MTEIWKQSEEYPYYEASNQGRIRNAMTKRINYGYVDAHGYVIVGGSDKKYKVQRLVALAFIPNPDNKPMVDHIDGNKINNSVKNLRWATREENAHNTKMWSSNKSGIKGVCFSVMGGGLTWRAKIYDNKKCITKAFTIKKHPDAKKKAIEWRKKKEIELGYTNL